MERKGDRSLEHPGGILMFESFLFLFVRFSLLSIFAFLDGHFYRTRGFSSEYGWLNRFSSTNRRSSETGLIFAARSAV